MITLKRLFLLACVTAFCTGASAPSDATHEIATLTGLADLYDQNAATNLALANMFDPETSAGENNARSYFRGRAEAYQDVARRTRLEIQWQFPEATTKRD